MTGPLDIPVASVDEDGNPSLFIKSDTIYADVTFEKKSTEYYLKIIHGGELQEIFDKELVDGRYIPPRLFGRLLGSVINK